MSQVMIVCNFDLGVNKQTIYKCDANGETSVEPIATVDFANLPTVLAQVYYQYNADSINLYGPHEIIERIAEVIREHGASEYSNANINIEIEE